MAIITNIKTVISNGPTAATQANANKGNLGSVSGSYIMDYPGLCNLVLTKLQEAKNLVTALIATTDGSDGSLTTLNTINSDLT
jgi:hypothetical protein